MSNQVINCPKGFRFEPSLGKCIPILESPVFRNCAQGFEKDPVTGECVPIKPIPPTPQQPPQPTNPNPKVVTIAIFADSKADKECDKTMAAIMKENPTHIIVNGDLSYAKDQAKDWISLAEKHKLKPKLAITQGNHDADEEDSEAAQKDLEAWVPALKTGVGGGGGPWTAAYQIENCYFINMNSQDLDYQYAGRKQHNWVKSELEKAAALRADGKIDWIFVSFHKPIYTLKTTHDPELKARDIYQPLFDQAQVDFINHGHNHDSQLWFPMSYNAKKLFTMMADGKTFDFSKAHGQFYMINGLAGRGQTAFKEDWKKNKNVQYASYSYYGYTVFYIKGRQLTCQYKSNSDGKVQHQIVVDKSAAGGQVVVNTPPTPQQPQTPQTPTPPPPTNNQQQFDEFGTRMIHKTTGQKVAMEKGSDHRNGQRFNNNHKFKNYMMIGYFKTGNGQEKLEMKTDGPNHGGCKKLPECMWYEPSIVVDTGEPELGGEWPHPDNHNNLPTDFKEKLSKPITQQWVGYCVIAYTNKDGNRVIEQWDALEPFGPDGKPTNKWHLNLRAVEKGQIFPKQYIPRDLDKVMAHENGFESEIRMHGATSGDTEMKNCFVYEIIPPN
jgi:hypothetical protein